MSENKEGLQYRVCIILILVMFGYGLCNFLFISAIAHLPSMGEMIVFSILVPFILLIGSWTFLMASDESTKVKWITGILVTVGYPIVGLFSFFGMVATWSAVT